MAMEVFVFPASFAQQRLWFVDQLEPNNALYNISRAIRMSGALNVEALQQTLEGIVARHESLRTTFSTVDGSPTQVIAERAAVALPVTDLSRLPDSEREAAMQRLAEEEGHRPFDLAQGPLFRASLLRLRDEEHVLLLTIHHIISDGWSAGILFREVGALYEAFSTGQASPLPELPIQYADFAQWQRQWLQGEVLEEQLSYWRERLLDAPPVLTVPADHPRPAVQSFRGAHQSLLLPKSVSEGLKALSQREGATLFMILLAAFQTLLYRYTGQEDIVIGSPIANRNRAEIEGLIGFFVNTLVLRTDLSGDPTFRELLGRVREVALGAYAHQDMPFEKLVEELQPDRDLSRSPLFQVSFALQNAPRSALELSGLKLRTLETESGTSKFDLTLFMWEQGEELRALFEYSTDLFEAATIRRMLGHLQTLLEGIVANPNQRLSELPLLSERERYQLLVEWNETAAEYPRESCIHQLFEAQVRGTPEAVAVECGGERVSYEELNRRANQLAHYLRALGVGPDVRVGICVERSVEMVVGILGILKAGGAYVPLDSEYPRERLEFMMEDAGAVVLLKQERLPKDIPHAGARVVRLDADWEQVRKESEENLDSGAGAENLAYVIYTSGSTGKPKGAMILHRGLVNYLSWCTKAYAVAEGSGTPVHSSIGFDLTVTGLFSPLLVGRSVLLVPEDERIEALSGALRQGDNFSLVKITPAHLEVLGQCMPADEAAGRTRALIIGGEALWAESLGFWRTHAPETRLINEYGPTETVVGCCVYEVGAEDAMTGAVPIGRPIANTQLYILDQHLNPMPIGVPGELYIGGDGLARGYLNRPELTAEKFIANPFIREGGARLYKTGDLARYLPDGTIEYLGRMDHQVKIRGYRIELGEIEATLAEHPAVRENVVIIREDTPGDKRLVAYVTQNLQFDSSGEREGTELQAEQVTQWRTLYDETYSQAAPHEDPTFNITGWNSSYTGLPIPEEGMREWVDNTVERILSLQPNRVLEIGCGTGLLLFRVAPHCTQYSGTDFSQVTVRNLEQHVKTANLRGVTLSQREASNFEGIATDTYDAVIINSVAQYFPSVDYLVRVLEGAVNAVEPGGAIFVGDVRSLPLLEAFHSSVELYQAASSLPTEQLREQVQRRLIDEEELVIAPAFFTALKQHLPKIGHVQILPKRGRHDNELTRFRYDVILHVGPLPPAPTAEIPWLEWQEQGLTLTTLRQLLKESGPEVLGIARVPNARVMADTQIRKLMEEDETLRTVDELREALGKIQGEGIDPEELWTMSEELHYSAQISWEGCDATGRYDVVFRRTTSVLETPKLAVPFPARVNITLRPWSHYANQPLGKTFFRSLVPKLRSLLEEKLPDYMVPSAFVLLDTMPLTRNGKVDRSALRTPDQARPQLEEDFVAPRTPVEQILAGIWVSVLGVEQVGVHNDFFDLGGHSLKATQVMSRVREAFRVELPLRIVFEAPTVAELAATILQCPGERGKVERAAQLLMSLAQLSEDEVETMLNEKTSLLKEAATR